MLYYESGAFLMRLTPTSRNDQETVIKEIDAMLAKQRIASALTSVDATP